MEIGVIAYCLRVVNDGWNLVSKTLSLRPKRVAQEIHDEASFFALLDPKNRKPVRHVDTHKHYYEFRVYVDEVVFEQRLIRTDKNWRVRSQKAVTEKGMSVKISALAEAKHLR